MNDTEIWKDVIGYEGLYQVSNLGRVKRIKHTTKKLFFSERIVNQYVNMNGYMMAPLSKDGKDKHKAVHRLVAQAFIPNPDNLPFVNHKDENPLNNHIDNLEWCTVKYNSNYGNSKTRMIESRKSNPNYRQSLTQGQITRNKLRCTGSEKPVLQFSLQGDFIREWKSLTTVERECGISRAGITRCCNGVYKQCKGYLWKFKG